MKNTKYLIRYNGIGSYDEWAKAVIKSGYTLSIKQLQAILDVSDTWIRNTLLAEENRIHRVVFDDKYVQKGMEKGQFKDRSTLYMSLYDVGGYIANNGSFSAQTELIDLYSYLYNANKKKAREALKLYEDEFIDGEFGNNKGTIPQRVLEYINKEFIINFKPRNLRVTKRTEVPWVKVEPFNIFETKYYFPKKNGNRELIYRNAFLRGDIKVNLGSRKTILIESDQDISKMKMPFLIKLNQSIIIYDSKGKQ